MQQVTIALCATFSKQFLTSKKIFLPISQMYQTLNIWIYTKHFHLYFKKSYNAKGPFITHGSLVILHWSRKRARKFLEAARQKWQRNQQDTNTHLKIKIFWLIICDNLKWIIVLLCRKIILPKNLMNFSSHYHPSHTFITMTRRSRLSPRWTEETWH